jgi:hypothetical protein
MVKKENCRTHSGIGLQISCKNTCFMRRCNSEGKLTLSGIKVNCLHLPINPAALVG